MRSITPPRRWLGVARQGWLGVGWRLLSSPSPNPYYLGYLLQVTLLQASERRSAGSGLPLYSFEYQVRG